MRKFVIVAGLSLALAGCESSLSSLLAPMEPSPASVAARRRVLTDAEKDMVSAAVSSRLKDPTHREFKWPALILGSHGSAADYCGVVNGNDIDGDYVGLSRFRAELTFSGQGKLSRVDVLSVGKVSNNDVPTPTDSLCMQEGYGPS
jgi:hypothetical protein